MHKAGFVNIVGNPNVGKSTLMNCVGRRTYLDCYVSRRRLLVTGLWVFYNTDDMQIVFSDTPGVLKPNYKLTGIYAQLLVLQHWLDADVLLYVTDT